ncbi:MAG TPA: hypothetical protein VFD60_06680 [Nitrososphaeraceae archaeon]|nr:hypothetical protein [Nitrososphaeraceae archaeon]
MTDGFTEDYCINVHSVILANEMILDELNREKQDKFDKDKVAKPRQILKL